MAKKKDNLKTVCLKCDERLALITSVLEDMADASVDEPLEGIVAVLSDVRRDLDLIYQHWDDSGSCRPVKEVTP